MKKRQTLREILKSFIIDHQARLKKLMMVGGCGLCLFWVLFLFAEAIFNSNFRSTHDRLWEHERVNAKGLHDLRASGGAAVRFWDLKRRLSHVRGPVVIIDSLNTYHGYIHGVPTSFFAYEDPSPHWKHFVRRLIFTGTTYIRPELIVPQEREAIKQGFFYVNVKIKSKNLMPKESVDEFVHVIEELPLEAWVHFQSDQGKGRATMMMVMYDIIRNAPKVSLQDILWRQHMLGSEDLSDTELWEEGTYSQEQLDERHKFIEDFYKFISQRKTRGIQNWSEWVTP